MASMGSAPSSVWIFYGLGESVHCLCSLLCFLLLFHYPCRPVLWLCLCSVLVLVMLVVCLSWVAELGAVLRAAPGWRRICMFWRSQSSLSTPLLLFCLFAWHKTMQIYSKSTNGFMPFFGAEYQFLCQLCCCLYNIFTSFHAWSMCQYHASILMGTHIQFFLLLLLYLVPF